MMLNEALMHTNPHNRWIFKSIVGSHNYGTNVDSSDIDIKVAYLPCMHEFWNHSFERTSNSGHDQHIDYTLHPIHEYLKHAFNGNINFWEIFFSKWFRMNPRFISIHDFTYIHLILKEIIHLNTLPNFHAMKGMAFQKSTIVPRHYAMSQYDEMWKNFQHTARLLDTIIHYVEHDQIILDLVSFLPNNPEWKNWRKRNGNVSKEEYEHTNKLIANKFAKVESLNSIVSSIDRSNSVKRIKLIEEINEFFIKMIYDWRG